MPLRPLFRVVLVLAFVLSASSGASAFTLELEDLNPSGNQFSGCGVEITGSSILVPVGSPALPGLGVQGGPSEFFVDGNDFVDFAFSAGSATAIRYTVSEIVASGGAVIEGFDAALDSLGTVEVSGTGEKDVSAAFGGVPLGAFRVSNSVGGHRIERLWFQPIDDTVVVDLRRAIDTQTPTNKYCGVGLAGSHDLYVDPVTGLGVGNSPGALDHFIEPGESVTVELDEPARSIGYTQVSSVPGIPEVTITGFGATGAALGDVVVAEGGPVNVTELFGGARLTGFQLAPDTGDLALTELVIVPEPDAGGVGLAALAGLAARRARRAAPGSASARRR